ncbi:paraquat-inducible protein A [Parvibaculaceae bacterium PLY_AMNH_Bact1]|nr:paraquat-inducible protein A [Parvibaculaceae bacterium PLY_AMNH_Bact1]
MNDVLPSFGPQPIKGRRWLMVLLLASLAMVIVGLQVPAVTVHSFWLYENDLSILDGIRSFFDEGQTALGLLVLAVSVVFPVGKILLGMLLIARGRRRAGGTGALLGMLVWLSRWSMTDVFVFALIVLVLNGQLLTSADVHGGVALFAGGVLLSAFAVSQVRRRLTAE